MHLIYFGSHNRVAGLPRANNRVGGTDGWVDHASCNHRQAPWSAQTAADLSVSELHWWCAEPWYFSGAGHGSTLCLVSYPALSRCILGAEMIVNLEDGIAITEMRQCVYRTAHDHEGRNACLFSLSASN